MGAGYGASQIDELLFAEAGVTRLDLPAIRRQADERQRRLGLLLDTPLPRACRQASAPVQPGRPAMRGVETNFDVLQQSQISRESRFWKVRRCRGVAVRDSGAGTKLAVEIDSAAVGSDNAANAVERSGLSRAVGAG